MEQVKSEHGTMALVHGHFDEVMAHLQQSQETHNIILDGGGSRRHQGVTCYSCQEEGHISTRCPHQKKRGMGRGMYQVQRNGQVPTIPRNINLLNFIDDSDKTCEVFLVKMTRPFNRKKK